MVARKLIFFTTTKNYKSNSTFRGDYNSSCLIGYRGALCGVCLKGFYYNRANGFSCNECGDNISNLFASLAILFAGMIFLSEFLL